MDSLESERLLLKSRKASHAEELYELFCDKDLYHFTKRDIPSSKEWFVKSFEGIENAVSADGKERWLGWVAYEKGDQRPHWLHHFQRFLGKGLCG
jgi:hypothetical protein